MLNPDDVSWIFNVSPKEIVSVIFLFVLLFIVGKIIYNWYEKIINKFGITTKKQREKLKSKECINENRESIKHLNELNNKTVETMTSLIPMVNNINESVSKLNTTVNILGENFNKFDERLSGVERQQENQEEINRKSTMANHKDRLYQAYRYYKSRAEKEGKREWTTIEKDGFDSLMDDYANNGGNSHVHNDVAPYMDEFIVNDDR